MRFDRLGFTIGGERAFLVSGEFHYFRVPKEDWHRRMRLFREAGGNCLATYVPWIVHEPEEGEILFGGEPYRDLPGFLRAAKEEGLRVLLRPGPYAYSELKLSGLPAWLVRDYPETLARDIDGRPLNGSSVSYLHPVLLQKARRYYRAFAEAVRPFLAERGGPIDMVQLDNELGGIHVWFGSMDYSAETMGFGREDGRFARFLREKYGSPARLNEAWGTALSSFAEARPARPGEEGGESTARRLRDYRLFYDETLAEYAETLRLWLREDGIGCPVCHNAANPNMNAMFRPMVRRLGEGFLLGSDHYYALNAFWPQNSPTPQYALRCLRSMDTLSSLGMPPTVFEMPGGSLADTPPILPEDLLACYMTNLALGMKGVNYYIYTGGPNAPGTAGTCDVYDYGAFVHADGSLNPTYESLRLFGAFLRENAWMQDAERTAAVQIGFTWDILRGEDDGVGRGSGKTWQALERGPLYTAMCSGFPPKLVDLEGELDESLPLVVHGEGNLSRKAQENLIAFLGRGGSLCLLAAVPDRDEELRPCGALGESLGVFGERPLPEECLVTETPSGLRVWGLNPRGALLPGGEDEVFCRDAESGEVTGLLRRARAGRVLYLRLDWQMLRFDMARFFEEAMAALGGQARVRLGNRNLFYALWEKGEDRLLFVMNLFSGAQQTTAEVFVDGAWKDAGRFALGPMRVEARRL